MKIKKTFQGSLPENKIINTHSDSQTDTYSCDYINNNLIQDSGWIDMELSSNSFASGSGVDKLQYRKIGNRVQLRGLLYLTGTMPSGRYFTRMPEEYRPKHNEYINVYYSGSSSAATIIILGDEYAVEAARGYIQASSLMTTSSSAFLSLGGISYLTD